MFEAGRGAARMQTANSKTLDDDIGARAYLPLPPREFSRDSVPADLDRSLLLRRLHEEHKARQARFTARPKPEETIAATRSSQPRAETITLIVRGFWGYHNLPHDLGDPLKHTVRTIQERVAKAFGVGMDELLGRSKYAPYVFARQVAMWLARHERPDLSLPLIGRLFASRDHTTVLHAVRKIDRLHAEGELILPEGLALNAPLRGGKEG